MELPVAKLLLREIKTKLKEQGLVYAEFSKKLGMSESGLKKLLASDDCAIGKIQKMCQALGLSFFDLAESIESQNLYETQFSAAQEAFFEKERTGFILYWLLVYERRSLIEAAQLLKLDGKKQQCLLLRLDRLNLVTLKAGGQLQIPDPIGIRWVGKTRFVLNLYRKWGLSLVERNLKNLTKSEPYFMIRYFRASDQTFKDLKKELKEIEQRFANKATREMRVDISSLKHVRWLIAIDNESWIETDELLTPQEI